MDGKEIRNKLVGSEEERAVSPVIGVILMVAITVILAAVIATLVMDFGDSTESPINAHVESNVESSTIELSVTEAGEASHFELRGDVSGLEVSHSSSTIAVADIGTGSNPTWDAVFPAETGETLSVSDNSWSGDTVNIVAIDGEQDENAGSFSQD